MRIKKNNLLILIILLLQGCFLMNQQNSDLTNKSYLVYDISEKKEDILFDKNGYASSFILKENPIFVGKIILKNDKIKVEYSKDLEHKAQITSFKEKISNLLNKSANEPAIYIIENLKNYKYKVLENS